MRLRFHTGSRNAFTLVELLVVVGIIALLIGILLPVLGKAQAASRSVKCMSNLRQIVQGFAAYSAQNNGYIVPSYNIPWAPGATTNVTGGPNQPLEGWASILSRDGYVSTNGVNQAPGKTSYYVDTNSVFYCPDTVDVAGMINGQTTQSGTLADQANPRGWADWPMIFTTAGGDSQPKQDTTIPDQGYNKVLRISYWINAYNPVGNVSSAVSLIAPNDLYYTASVGFGPDPAGAFITLHKTTNIKHSSRLIVVADGLYAGRQSVDAIGMNNCRIGYRHSGTKGQNTVANAGFADGHVESLTGDQFPCTYAKTTSYAANKGTVTFAQEEANNLNGATIYADPDGVLQTFLTANPGAN
jgi:prepilin-type N-terminal cleavage/methylation domain-containing protein/prepilin-type processing-associated H-X9-DG protein